MRIRFGLRIKFGLMICAVLIFGGCALNQDVKNIERRMAQLEIENKSLRDRIQRLKTDISSRAEMENSLRELYAGQGAEFYEFKEETRQLNGRLNEIEYQLNKDIRAVSEAVQNTGSTVSHFSQTVAENSSRIQRIEQFVGFEPGGVSAAADSETPRTPDKMSEDELYKVSKQAYDRADYESARQGFTKFLELYPKSDKADNARFWTGEIYFSEQWYQKAILEYQQVIENYPNGNKVASAYLKQGLSFHKLGEDANALLVFKELIRKYPDANEAKIARQQVARIE